MKRKFVEPHTPEHQVVSISFLMYIAYNKKCLLTFQLHLQIRTVTFNENPLRRNTSSTTDTESSYTPSFDSPVSENSIKVKARKKSYYVDYFVSPGEIEWKLEEDSIRVSNIIIITDFIIHQREFFFIS